jgi:hypothetical protein
MSMLPRDKYSNGVEEERKRLFNVGYPPLGSIFNRSFWITYDEAFKQWCMLVDQLEDMWDAMQHETNPWKVLAKKNIQNSGKPSVPVKPFFSNSIVDSVIKQSEYLGENWRQELAAFFKEHFTKTQNAERLFLVFLLSYNNEGNKVEDNDLFFMPSHWLTELIDAVMITGK